MIREITFNENSNVRLDNYLKNEFSDYSRTLIQKMIKNGKVKVDNYIVKPSFILKNKHTISIEEFKSKKSSHNLIPQKMELKIIYEDDSLIIIDKPSGIVVHPGAGNKDGTLLNGLLYHYKNLSKIDKSRPGIIHRLDKQTSGVMIFAKTDQCHYLISNQFAERKVKKKYNALVWGKINSSGMIEGKISRNPKNRLAFKVSQQKGKYSKTNYLINKNYNSPITLLDIFPLTGRTHQIRVHLSSLGFPILNDSLYGGDKNKIKSFNTPFKSNIKNVLNMIQRVALHANEISFYHPFEKREVVFTAPLPSDFINAMRILKDG